ncbi:MAG TPA: hypothetical protein VJ183_08065 [Chloroflexia bacterium]|nr:hypothetical protein [Chloroflexia bacterium]
MTYIEWVSKVWGAFRKQWFSAQAYDRRWGIDAYHLARALASDLDTKEYQKLVKATSTALADLSHPKMGFLKAGSEGLHLSYILEPDVGLILRPSDRSFPEEMSEQEIILLQALAERSEVPGPDYARLKECTMSVLYREVGKLLDQTTPNEMELRLNSLAAHGLISCRVKGGEIRCRPTFDGMVFAQRLRDKQGTIEYPPHTDLLEYKDNG